MVTSGAASVPSWQAAMYLQSATADHPDGTLVPKPVRRRAARRKKKANVATPETPATLLDLLNPFEIRDKYGIGLIPSIFLP